MKYRHLFSYPFYHLRQATRLALPRKAFHGINFKYSIIFAMTTFVVIYEILDITKHFIIPAQHFQRDRFNLLQTKTSFQTLILSQQPLSARQKLQERSLF